MVAAVKFSMTSNGSLALHNINPTWYWCYWPWIYAVQYEVQNLTNLETLIQNLSLAEISKNID